MIVTHGIPDGSLGSIALTIGNFDGVHLGHQALLQNLRQRASSIGFPACVLTFEPQPREFFSPDTAPVRLTTMREKIEWLNFFGVDRVHFCRFNKQFASITAEKFVEDILVRGLKVRWLLVGDDFRFGAKRAGDYAMLQKASTSFGFGLERLETVLFEGQRISSSVARTAVASGDMDKARILLGRPYSIHGRVIHGDKLGRTLGVATANVQLKCKQPLLRGIYAVQMVGIADKPFNGVASLGVRPTINNLGKASLEVHLFDFNGDLYRRHVRVDFLHKIRDEEKYDDLDSLKKQMGKDIKVAKGYFNDNELDKANRL